MSRLNGTDTLTRRSILQAGTALLTCSLLCGCFGNSPDSSSESTSGNDVKIAAPEGDTSVSAEDGGPGFTGNGWTTTEFDANAKTAAIRGGAILTSIPNWPENLRVYGTGSNTYLNSIVEGLVYESLLTLDPNTLEFRPSLASHWKISDDKMKFTFRINPRAHWSDGQPVTADDVLATYKLVMDKTLIDPMSQAVFEKFNPPVKKSKYIVEFECKEKDWRNFISAAGFVILPAHEIGTLTGKDYLDKYNFKYTVVSGPYSVNPDDIKENESITITRRKNYWGESEPQNLGLFNFEKIRFEVIRDDRLAFDKACKGELHFYHVNTAKWWVEDLGNLDAIKKGHLIRQKVYTKHPAGFQGIACQLTDPLMADVRVRKALGHLFDRKTMLDKFAYNEYDPLKSYFPGSDAENLKNELVEYNLNKATALLSEAGWKDRGGDGILLKDGKRLSITLTYVTPGLEKYFTTYQQDCKKAGVEIKLELLTPETQWKRSQEKKFQFSSQAWGAVNFPYPMTMWHSKMAKENGSNNITGFADKKVDALIEEYNQEFDVAKRTVLLKEIDGEIFKHHPYVMAWYLPCERLLYWNRFGMPETALPKYGDYRSIFATWWFDASKQEKLDAARKSGTPIAPIPPAVLKPWDEPAKTASRN